MCLTYWRTPKHHTDWTLFAILGNIQRTRCHALNGHTVEKACTTLSVAGWTVCCVTQGHTVLIIFPTMSDKITTYCCKLYATLLTYIPTYCVRINRHCVECINNTEATHARTVCLVIFAHSVEVAWHIMPGVQPTHWTSCFGHCHHGL
jgi:hypothetical protein